MKIMDKLMNTQFIKTERTDSLTGGKIYIYRHPCGLTLQWIPKPKFSKKFAGFLVPYGSIHSSFRTEDGIVSVPAGTAHYLEHCVFSKEDEGGLLSRLSSLGASANAYTSHTHTFYYFTAVDHFLKAFEMYFKTVINPYLEQDRVESERNVILQELEMYQDDPDNRSFSDMIESLYFTHPVRIDIGGTEESVKQIVPDHLKQIRKYFYTPSALTVTVSGDVEEDGLLELLEQCIGEYRTGAGRDFKNHPGEKHPEFIFGDEPEIIGKKESSYEMDVTAESFLIGIKNPRVSAASPVTGRARVLNQKSGQLFFEMLLGNSSEIFETLYSEGMINDSFGFQYICEETYSYLAIGGESPDPKQAAAKLYRLMMEQFAQKQDPRDFELQKRVAAGNFIRSLDAVEHCGMSAAIAEMSGLNIFDYPEIYDMIELNSVMDSMRFVCDPNLKTEAFILKKGTQK